MRAFIRVRGQDGFADGPFSIGITNIATSQTTVPPLAFPTSEAAATVVRAIVEGNPTLYTDVWPYRPEGHDDPLDGYALNDPKRQILESQEG